MLTSAKIPSDEPIRDFSVVDHAGELLVVCADWTGRMWTWSVASGEWTPRPLPFAHAADPVMADYPDAENEFDRVAALSTGGSLLIAAGGDEQEPAAWNLETGELLWRTPVTGAYLADVVAVDGGFVTAEQNSEELRSWTPDGSVSLLGEPGYPYRLSFARIAERSLLLVGGSGVTVFNAATGTELESFDPDDARAWDVTACPLGDRTAVYAVTDERKLWGWELGVDEDEAELFEPVDVADVDVDTVAVLPVGGRTMVVTGDEKALRLWNAADGTAAGTIDVPGQLTTTMDSTVMDGKPVLVTAGRDGRLRIWDESDFPA
ncbi:MAG: hypothetical protein ACRD0P_01485 [Stackebrandtia sp.]